MFTAAVLLISLWRHFDLNPLSEWGLQGCLTWAACAGERSFSFLIFFFLLQTYHCWQAYKRPVIYVLGVLCFPSVKINVNTNNLYFSHTAFASSSSHLTRRRQLFVDMPLNDCFVIGCFLHGCEENVLSAWVCLFSD